MMIDYNLLFCSGMLIINALLSDFVVTRGIASKYNTHMDVVLVTLSSMVILSRYTELFI